MAPFVGETLREISLKLPTLTSAVQENRHKSEERKMQRGEREEGAWCVPLFVWPLNAAIISLKSHSVRQLRGKQWKRIRIPKWTDCHRQPQPQQQKQQQEEEALEEEEQEEEVEEQPKAQIAHFRSSKYLEINQSSRQGDWLGSDVHRESLIDVPCLKELSIVECWTSLYCSWVCSGVYGSALYQLHFGGLGKEREIKVTE